MLKQLEPSPEAKSLAHTWAGQFEKVGPTGGPAQEWIDLHSESIVYRDHAHQLQRSGLAGVANHIGLWKWSNPDFKMDVTDVWPELKLSGKRRLTFEFIGSGTFLKDLSPEIKASGKFFSYKGRIDLTINRDGLIEAVDEYYPFQFDRGTSVEDYRKKEKDGQQRAAK